MWGTIGCGRECVELISTGPIWRAEPLWALRENARRDWGGFRNAAQGFGLWWRISQLLNVGSYCYLWVKGRPAADGVHSTAAINIVSLVTVPVMSWGSCNMLAWVQTTQARSLDTSEQRVSKTLVFRLVCTKPTRCLFKAQSPEAHYLRFWREAQEFAFVKEPNIFQ